MPTELLTYDADKIQANLAVLRTFRLGEGRGARATKLFVHPDGTFERMESGLRTAWKRTFGDRQQSLSDTFVLQAVYDLFEQAAPGVPRSNALAIATNVADAQRPLREFLDAYQGFAVLAIDYDKSPVPKLFASKILDDCVRPVIRSIVFPAVRAAPDTSRLLTFNQGSHLEDNDPGKCFGFTMEWGRRYIQSGKFSFTEHNPSGKGSYGQGIDPDSDPLVDMRRMFDFKDWVKKRMDRIAILQLDQRYHEQITAPSPLDPDDRIVIGKKASLQKSVMGPRAPAELARLMEKVGAIKRVHLRDIRPPEPRWLAMPSNYTAMCSDIVRSAWDDLGSCGRTYTREKVAAINARLAALRHEHPERATDSALADLPVPVLAEPQKTIRASYALHWSGNYVFPHGGKASSGHTMGLLFYFPQGGVPRYVFFDPNFGEYEVTLHTPATPDVTVMAAIFSYYSATFEMSRYSVDRMWEE
jgi:hypothetical protein